MSGKKGGDGEHRANPNETQHGLRTPRRGAPRTEGQASMSGGRTAGRVRNPRRVHARASTWPWLWLGRVQSGCAALARF